VTVALQLVARDLGALVEDPLVLLLIEGQAQTKVRRSPASRCFRASAGLPVFGNSTESTLVVSGSTFMRHGGCVDWGCASGSMASIVGPRDGRECDTAPAPAT